MCLDHPNSSHTKRVYSGRAEKRPTHDCLTLCHQVLLVSLDPWSLLLLQGKLGFVLGYQAELVVMGHPQRTKCAHLRPQGWCPQLLPLLVIYTLTHTSLPLRAHAQKGLFPEPAGVGSPRMLCPGLLILAICLSHPRTPCNSLSGLVPLALAPGCLLPALQACLYVLAAAEF